MSRYVTLERDATVSREICPPNLAAPKFAKCKRGGVTACTGVRRLCCLRSLFGARGKKPASIFLEVAPISKRF